MPIKQHILTLDPIVARLQDTIEAKRHELGVPGCALVIVRRGSVVCKSGFGWRDVQRGLPVTPKTLFALGSCTKGFTGLLVAMAAAEAKMSLNDSPARYLPYFHLTDPDANARVTLCDLLCHRSGIPSGAGELAGISGVMSRSEVIQVACHVKPTAKLGTRFQYNSALFAAAGEAVGRAQGTSWERLLHERIFRPLGMTASNTSPWAMRHSADYATGYDFSTDEAIPPAASQRRKCVTVPLVDTAPLGPAGSINSNGNDLAAWLQLLLAKGLLLGQRVVSAHAIEELFTPRIEVWEGQHYGLGWGISRNDWNGYPGIWHNGTVPGFYAEIRLLPDQELGYALLCNVTNSREARSLAGLVHDVVCTSFIGEPHPKAKPTQIAPPPATPTRFVAPLSADELMAKMAVALGGRSNLSKIKRVRQAFTFSAEEQGIMGKGTVVWEAPHRKRMHRVLRALNKTIGTVDNYCDARSGGIRRHIGFLSSEEYKGTTLADAQIAAILWDVLDWRRLYRTVEITGREKVDGEDTYVVRKTPYHGTPFTDYVSTRSFLLLKRRGPSGVTVYRKYRVKDGVLLPMEWIQEDDYLGTNAIQVLQTELAKG